LIISMAKVRIIGPRASAATVLAALQDIGLVHLTTPVLGELEERLEVERRFQDHLRSILIDVERALTGLAIKPAQENRAREVSLAAWARQARRLAREVDRLVGRRAALDEEAALLDKYGDLLTAFEPLAVSEEELDHARAYYLMLHGRDGPDEPKLRQSLKEVLGDRFSLHVRPLPSQDVAVVLLAPSARAGEIDRLLHEAGIQEVDVGDRYGSTVGRALPRMRARRGEIKTELAQLEELRRRLAKQHASWLRSVQAALHDLALSLEARAHVHRTQHLFLIEGWIPNDRFEELSVKLEAAAGPTVVVERVLAQDWRKEEAPVVLSNPALFRPFEILTSMLPLPRYGTIDPTPFVAIFFPLFFGLILGDIGYGLLAALLALLLLLRSKPNSRLRAAAKVLGACAAFTIVFGFLYGELFGDLGRHWLHLEPILFDREESLIPSLLLAIALGVVHILLGLCLGVVSAMKKSPRHALGRGISLVMVVLIALSLLAAFEVLPALLFTPFVVALLVAFPILIAVEGLLGPIELMSTIANVLSYARIMALGTASVVMAVIANRLAGAMGSAVIGVLFALLFHLVNFALGLFSPTIHALRLHYVEFFGKFYSPGGVQYRPFGHWRLTWNN
jgi:V/A-type H+-transporting ATPase subunit I